eukprot:7066531-Alexandrium_andersonii.AAC.1
MPEAGSRGPSVARACECMRDGLHALSAQGVNRCVRHRLEREEVRATQRAARGGLGLPSRCC